MYAIAELSGKQFRIEPGSELKVPKQPGKVGDKVVLDKVLFFDNDSDKLIGTPFIKDMSIEGKISSHGRDKKIIVFKMKRRKRYRRKHGHRQDFSMVKVDKIEFYSCYIFILNIVFSIIEITLSWGTYLLPHLKL